MKATAFAPATVANVAVGFDILGFALQSLGESATVELISGHRKISIEPIAGYPALSLDPRTNTATARLLQLMRDKKLQHGFHVSLKKNIPVGSGLGGSSTSAVAAIVAASHLLKTPLTIDELLHYALIGEEVASGARHSDNIAPCLHGGLVFVRGAASAGRQTNSRTSNQLTKMDVVQIPTPKQLHCVIILPAVQINTKQARSILKKNVSLSSMVQQTSNLAGLILGCAQNDFSLIRSSLKDAVIESQRASQIPGFYEFQKIALRKKALGCSISGSGPAIFAWAESSADARDINQAWIRAAKKLGIAVHGAWTSPIHQRGAHIVGVSR